MEREKILTVLRGGGHEKGQNQNKDTYKLLCLNHCSKIPKKTIKLFPKLIAETESQKKNELRSVPRARALHSTCPAALPAWEGTSWGKRGLLAQLSRRQNIHQLQDADSQPNREAEHRETGQQIKALYNSVRLGAVVGLRVLQQCCKLLQQTEAPW